MTRTKLALWLLATLTGTLAPGRPSAAQAVGGRSAPPTAPAPARALPADLDAYVAKAMGEWKVPGLALAIVRNDSVVLAKGYGVRTLGRPERVGERTLFAIGSASKAFTATAVAMLVDDGKVRWDDPATQYLPGFQLYDPYVTRELTVRDLLTHRSGLERGDLLWFGSEYNRAEILRRVRYLKPTWSLRSHFGYQNIMYLAAGQVAANVTGRPWEDVVRERILAPLGMTSTNTSVTALEGQPDVATPHAKVDDTVRAIRYRNIDNIAPAGSINSNVLDMAKWVRFQLAGGRAGGRQLISTASLDETHSSQTVIDLEPPWSLFNPSAHFLNYGMGWFLHDFGGRKVVEHGGNIDGMSALVAMMPEEKTGLVILTNMDGSALTYALMNRVFDAYLGQPPRDWSAEMRKTFAAFEAQQKEVERKREAQRVKGTRPSLPLPAYAGAYSDSMYGDARVRLEKGRLVLQTSPALVADMEHWHYDTFRAQWRDRQLGRTFVTFAIGEDAKPSRLSVTDLADFKRQAERPDSAAGVVIAAAELEKYAGSFASQAPPIAIEVQLVGSALKLSVPGQPLYTLVPVSTTRFRLTGPPGTTGYFVDYTLEGGKATRLTLVQPEPQPSLVLSRTQPSAGR